MKLDLLTNARVVDDAIKCVQKAGNTAHIHGNEERIEEHPEEELKTETTNQVF